MANLYVRHVPQRVDDLHPTIILLVAGHSLCLLLLPRHGLDHHDKGIYNRLTWWEQIDSGKLYARSRKFLTVVPILLYLIASHTTDYQHPMLFFNTLAVFVLVLPSSPICTKFVYLESMPKLRSIHIASPLLPIFLSISIFYCKLGTLTNRASLYQILVLPSGC